MKVVVVARYEEDVSWLDAAEGWIPLVVQKGVDMPNEGREAASFFLAFDRLYPDLADDDTVMCLQGYPLDHVTVIPWRKEPKRFALVGDNRYESDKNGYPHHGGLPVAKRLEEWFGVEWPGRDIPFAAGGQFALRGDRVKRYPRDLYRRLVDEMAKEEHPWVMERLWESAYA